ncbi:MAG: CocE/NonD family hydrolase [Aureispira sp.]|nr:CocE/NonD family hydrolase [Aureispira sp.]
MIKVLLSSICILLCLTSSYGQNNNGMLDDISEFSTKQTVPIRMPGGIDLMTDIYLPITSDSLTVETTLGSDTIEVQLIPKGTQLIIYPTMIDSNGDTIANPNPYQLPIVYTRTPYDKDTDEAAGAIFSFLGYAYANQDMRGRYASEGVYLPMYSDSWQKAPYHSHNHILDITASLDSANGRFHEDGWASYQYLINDLKKGFDLDNDGNIDTVAHICNGSVGMFGASALGNTQYQLAAAHKIDTAQKGLRCLLPIVATNEHYNTTGYNNGVYRTMISSGWITGQLQDIQDTVGTDNDIQNNVHSPFDFGLTTEAAVIDLGIYHNTSAQYGGTNIAAAYPNSLNRMEMDASRAPVDALGEGDANGTFSRYSNMDVAAYHLTGWYDIFINGQIDTWNNMKSNLSGSNQQLQKLVIGPWAHQTIGDTTTGDQTYPDNVKDIIDVSVDNINDLDLNATLNSELLAWYRYNLNERGYVHLGEPMVRLPESQVWQQGPSFTFRVPASNYDITLVDMVNFLGGMKGLPQMPVEIDLGSGSTITTNIDLPLITGTPPFPLTDTAEAPQSVDFKSSIPDIRFYVIGPTDTLATSQDVGNYWFASDEFPLTGPEIQFTPYYLHQNGVLDGNIPTFDEGTLMYTHDPDTPVVTVGGANMIVNTPQNTRRSQGQMNYADPNFAPYTMNNSGVIQFQTAALTDTLAIIGLPKATIYAKSEPQGVGSGPTDTDFFIRIIDVYPDGRELNVVEGAVNARAREYARSIYNGAENDTATFSNINIGQWYEYQLEMLPIAYTFGEQHSMKVLISSGNFPRYQSNANVPIEDGEFFRHNPNDGLTYDYQGQTYSPRLADNSIAFSDTRPSRIELPIYGASVVTSTTDIEQKTVESTIRVYPNPTKDMVTIQTDDDSAFELTVFNQLGQEVYSSNFDGHTHSFNLKKMPSGVYLVELLDMNTDQKHIQKLVKK